MLGAKSIYSNECYEGQFIGASFLPNEDLTNNLFENWEWEDMIELVDDAHLRVLEEFEIQKIWFALRRRAYEINLPPILFNKAIPIDV